MQTALTQIAVGDYDVTWHRDLGRVRLRDVTSKSLTRALLPRLGLGRNHLTWLQSRLGPYPGDVQGVLAVDLPLQLALETTTLPVFDAASILEPPLGKVEPHMVHELAHAWFGNSVSPAQWSDAWLSEGHAYLYQILYAADRGYLPVEAEGLETMEQFWTAVHGLSDQLRAAYGPVALPRGGQFGELFSLNAYLGGALVLEALRRHVGEDTFQTIEREWLRRNANGSASTADFVDLASEVAHEDLGAFMHAWLYEETTPPLPPLPA
jgi:aminopeptidase N